MTQTPEQLAKYINMWLGSPNFDLTGTLTAHDAEVRAELLATGPCGMHPRIFVKKDVHPSDEYHSLGIEKITETCILCLELESKLAALDAQSVANLPIDRGYCGRCGNSIPECKCVPDANEGRGTMTTMKTSECPHCGEKYTGMDPHIVCKKAIPHTDEAKKLVAEALECTMLCDDTSKYRHPEEHFKSCPAHHRPVVESLVSRLLADNARWKKAIEGLTPSGSEFVDDPERCATYIRERCQYPKMIVDLLADKERLTEALREIVKGVDDWNKAVSKVIQIEETHAWPGLEHARALIEKASHQP